MWCWGERRREGSGYFGCGDGKVCGRALDSLDDEVERDVGELWISLVLREKYAGELWDVGLTRCGFEVSISGWCEKEPERSE